MYTGHLAIGFALKAKYVKVPALPIIMGAGLLDILYGVFIIVGIDKVTPNLKSGPYMFFDLKFVDWDHSLFMAAVFSFLWALLFIKERRTAIVAGAAVFLHFIADWPVHNNELALYPYAHIHIGYGLWSKLGTYAWVLEGGFTAILAAYAWRSYARRGLCLLWPCVLLLVLFLQMSPWLSPLRMAATFDEPAAHIVHGLLTLTGYLVPGFLLIWLFNREERQTNDLKKSVLVQNE